MTALGVSCISMGLSQRALFECAPELVTSGTYRFMQKALHLVAHVQSLMVPSWQLGSGTTKQSAFVYVQAHSAVCTHGAANLDGFFWYAQNCSLSSVHDKPIAEWSDTEAWEDSEERVIATGGWHGRDSLSPYERQALFEVSANQRVDLRLCPSEALL